MDANFAVQAANFYKQIQDESYKGIRENVYSKDNTITVGGFRWEDARQLGKIMSKYFIKVIINGKVYDIEGEVETGVSFSNDFIAAAIYDAIRTDMEGLILKEVASVIKTTHYAAFAFELKNLTK